MRLLSFLLILSVVTPAWADPITWKASNTGVSIYSDTDYFVPGLTSVPWSLTVTFDPAAPPTRILTHGCHQYSMEPSTLTLGNFRYTNASGVIFTNAALPEIGCGGGMLPEGEAGLIQFWYGTAGWISEDPGAWNLAAMGGITYAGYYDLFATDGTLPTVPVFNPVQGWYGGMEMENAFLGDVGLYGGQARFELVDQSPLTPVPEPATMTLIGTGLAALIAAKRRRR